LHPSSDKALNAADIESLEREIVELALDRTGARHGAIFLWDERAKGLAIDFHIVEGLVVTLPGVVLRRGRAGQPSGIAFEALDRNEVYLCSETRDDPNYAPYFLDVRSVLAAPIAYQRRAIGVITVSSRRPHAFDHRHVAALEEVADASAKFLRRAQLYRATGKNDQRPFLIKGISPEWLEVERKIEQVAATEAAVLIHGESGTGKELVARAIHFNSRREGKPFVTVNCAAIPETMLESVLFGHVSGAFTGATFDKLGEFQKAHGGTLFLDEVGELPMALQAKVLRAVELGEVQPLGSNKPAAHVDVRLLCATHRDLPRLAEQGTFRADLYYRLSVMTMELPPLRNYKDNLEVLAHVFIQEAARRHGKLAPRLSPAALATLAAHDFPGNVRELKNAVEHAVIMCAGDAIEPHDLPPSVCAVPGPEPAAAKPLARKTLRELREQWLAPLERRYLAELLDECGGNVRRAADEAGINTVTMYRLLRKRGLQLRRVAE
jgi:DNA-binding NtrC family response regulator